MDVDDAAPRGRPSSGRRSRAAAEDEDAFQPDPRDLSSAAADPRKSAGKRTKRSKVADAEDGLSVELAGVRLTDHPADADGDAPLPVQLLLGPSTMVDTSPAATLSADLSQLLDALSVCQPSPSESAVVDALVALEPSVDRSLARELARIIGRLVDAHGASILAGCAESSQLFDDTDGAALVLLHLVVAIDRSLRAHFGSHAGEAMQGLRAALDDVFVCRCLVGTARGVARVLGRPDAPSSPDAESPDAAASAAMLTEIGAAVLSTVPACAAEVGAVAKGGPSTTLHIRLARSVVLLTAIVIGGASIDYGVSTARVDSR